MMKTSRKFKKLNKIDMTDFSKLQFMSKANPRKSDYDIQMLKDDHFRVSSEAFAKFGLSLNGFTQADDVDKVFLAIGASEKSVFYKTSSKGDKKSFVFKNSNLARKLEDLYNSNVGDKFTLNSEGDYNGYNMCQLVPLNPASQPINVPVDNTAEEELPAPEVPVEKPQEIVAEEKVKEEPPAQEEAQVADDVSDDDFELY